MTQLANVTVLGNTDTDDFVPTDTVNVFDPVETADKVYTLYELHISYVTDYHTVQLPVASDQVSTASFAVLANGTMKRIVELDASTTGEFPSLPAAFSGDTNERLLNTEILSVNVEADGSGGVPIFRFKLRYIYGIVDKSKVTMYCATSPYLTWTLQDNVIPASIFKGGISSPYNPNISVSMG